MLRDTETEAQKKGFCEKDTLKPIVKSLGGGLCGNPGNRKFEALPSLGDCWKSTVLDLGYK